MKEQLIEASSYRDPSGFLFYDGTTLYRQVNQIYSEDYEYLMNSGLYEFLVQRGHIVSHIEEPDQPGITPDAYKVLRPEIIDFISYPYEWSFHQLKDAALLTLKIQRAALKRNLTLKDATAYNVQFKQGKPIFIDTLSFEQYEEGKPWIAYGQFCECFLAPLALMSYKHVDLNNLLRVYLNGIPLEITSRLLPFRTRLNISLYLHIHLHARMQKKYEDKPQKSKPTYLTRKRLIALIENLIDTIEGLSISTKNTQWANYYSFTNYSDASFGQKKQIISEYLEHINPEKVWDFGANTGIFTQIAATKGAQCVAFDIDPLAVDTNYLHLRENPELNILPLILDLTNPSPGLGWNNNERMSLKARPFPDVIMALALIHHLCISNNLPFYKVAEFLASLTNYLIIEFVPKSDSQVKKLLESRKDIFHNYNKNEFEEVFCQYFTITFKRPVSGSERTIYLMKNLIPPKEK